MNKPQYKIEDRDKGLRSEASKYNRRGVRLPKLREKITLHITDQGPKILSKG